MRLIVLWWCKCSYTGLLSEGKTKNVVTLLWKWSNYMWHWTLAQHFTSQTLKNPRIRSQKPKCVKPCHVLFHISTMQTQLCLISLTWEKFLALILTSFSTSSCRWKVSSCSLFSASSLLLLSSSSIWWRARLSRSWRTALSLNIFLICARAAQRTRALLFCSQNSARYSFIYVHLFLPRAAGHRVAPPRCSSL